jgi:Zn-dependent peptidase ImmA (M78 family)
MLLSCITMMNNMESKQEESKREVRHRFNVVRQFAYVHKSESGYISSFNQFGLQYNIYILKPYYPQNNLVNIAINRVSLDARLDGLALAFGR